MHWPEPSSASDRESRSPLVSLRRYAGTARLVGFEFEREARVL
jgi:hypothetical protein